MRRIAAFVVALVLAACAATPTPSGVLAASYDAVATYQRLVKSSVDRGRITSAQAMALVDQGERARGQVDRARDALALCGGKMPCDSYDEIIRRVQPMLAELELKLREEEARKK